MKRGSAGSAGLGVIGGLSLGARQSRFPLVGRGIERTGGLRCSRPERSSWPRASSRSPRREASPVIFLAWIVIGLGMGAGLYNPAFSTLGRIYGQSARSLITAVTLFGGFASTVCWPLTALRRFGPPIRSTAASRITSKSDDAAPTRPEGRNIRFASNTGRRGQAA